MLLTDVVLPESSGVRLAEELAPARPEMKVLYVSGNTGDATAHHGVLDSSFAFLSKSYPFTALGKKIREVLETKKEKRRSRRALVKSCRGNAWRSFEPQTARRSG